jgi:hypothetical protein
MAPYYFGGYFLIKQRPIDFGSLKAKTVFTCSSCINDHLLGNWSYSWVSDNNANIKDIYNDYQIDGIKIVGLRSWVDGKFEADDIKWGNVFSNIETAKLYKQTFFSHLKNISLIGIYFSDSEANELLEAFEANKIGLYQNLVKRIPEEQSKNEQLIGFDLIGIEHSGDFHTFYCHDISKELTDKFNLKFNSFGLIKDSDNWKQVLDYMNDEETGLEPVPWFSIKMKLVKE